VGRCCLQDKEVKESGPDRMMVFQNYSLLPWKTAFENVYIGVNSVYPENLRLRR
jgi:nitrate/nitrite transport system ATP-binding protein